MRKDCKHCKKWEHHFYWSHMDHTRISFCKNMDASSTNFMNKMDLPNDFSRNFRGRIGEIVELKGPSGDVWRVGVIKSITKLTFQSGWKEFVIANGIEANDRLVFKYSGNSLFEVRIFDPSGCERTTSFFAQVEEIAAQDQESSDSSIEVFEGPDRNTHEDDKITISSSSSYSEYSTDSVPVRTPGGRAGKDAGTSKEPDTRRKFKEPDDNNQIFFSKKSQPPALKKMVARLRERIQPRNHCFAVLMKPSMVTGRCRFHIPRAFAMEHLPRQIIRAFLHYNESTWPVNISYDNLSSGFKKFAEDNAVQEGDLCLFELVKNSKTVSFKVHISRK